MSSAATNTTAQAPNIVFILADDLGWADLSVYGQADFTTPHLDALAGEGVRFTQAYANSAVCSATRFALITGRYQYRLRGGLEEPLVRKAHVHGLPPEHPTLPSLLRDAGYDTALIGKWHLGSLPTFGPLKSGYDRFFGNYGGAIDYFTHKPGVGDAVARDLYEGEVPVERVGYYTQLLADEATRWIGERSATKPFFLSLHFTAPHWPWVGPEDEEISLGLKDLFHYDGGNLATYARMVRSLDKAVGQVLEALKAQGLADNTIVVFTSDNGGERFSKTWPFTGQKTELLEGGIRVPTLLRLPARIAPQVSDQVTATMDWLPTLLAAAGVTPDGNYPPDGENILPVLLGDAPAHTVLALQGAAPARGTRGPLQVPSHQRQRVSVRRGSRHAGARQPARQTPRSVRPIAHGVGAVECAVPAHHRRGHHPRPVARHPGRPLCARPEPAGHVRPLCGRKPKKVTDALVKYALDAIKNIVSASSLPDGPYGCGPKGSSPVRALAGGRHRDIVGTAFYS